MPKKSSFTRKGPEGDGALGLCKGNRPQEGNCEDKNFGDVVKKKKPFAEKGEGESPSNGRAPGVVLSRSSEASSSASRRGTYTQLMPNLQKAEKQRMTSAPAIRKTK